LANEEKTKNPILKMIVKFCGDIDLFLKFKIATLPIFTFLKFQEIQKAKKIRILEANEESKLRWRKERGIDSRSISEAICQEPGKKSQMEKKLEQRYIPLEKKMKMKVNSQLQEAQRLDDKERKDDIRLEDSH
jgi:hypothetical protein